MRSSRILKKMKKSIKAVSFVESDFDDDAGLVLFVTDDLVYSRDLWILYSACFYHVCPDENLFVSYKACNAGSVIMENNLPCKMVGTGTIIIKMHDGVGV